MLKLAFWITRQTLMTKEMAKAMAFLLLGLPLSLSLLKNIGLITPAIETELVSSFLPYWVLIWPIQFFSVIPKNIHYFKRLPLSRRSLTGAIVLSAVLANICSVLGVIGYKYLAEFLYNNEIYDFYSALGYYILFLLVLPLACFVYAMSLSAKQNLHLIEKKSNKFLTILFTTMVAGIFLITTFPLLGSSMFFGSLSVLFLSLWSRILGFTLHQERKILLFSNGATFTVFVLVMSSILFFLKDIKDAPFRQMMLGSLAPKLNVKQLSQDLSQAKNFSDFDERINSLEFAILLDANGFEKRMFEGSDFKKIFSLIDFQVDLEKFHQIPKYFKEKSLSHDDFKLWISALGKAKSHRSAIKQIFPNFAHLDLSKENWKDLLLSKNYWAEAAFAVYWAGVNEKSDIDEKALELFMSQNEDPTLASSAYTLKKLLGFRKTLPSTRSLASAQAQAQTDECESLKGVAANSLLNSQEGLINHCLRRYFHQEREADIAWITLPLSPGMVENFENFFNKK